MFRRKRGRKKGFFGAVNKFTKQAQKMYKQHQKYQKQRHQNYNNITLAQVDRMTGEEFEYFLASLFTRMGYKVQNTPLSGDYGADLILQGQGGVTVVQAKRYKSNVGVSAVQEIVSARPMYNAQRAMVVSNAEFTQQAQTLARANGVLLVGRTMLADMVRQAFG